MTNPDGSADRSEPGRSGADAPVVRWPAEWEPHAATWLAWPHNRDTWGKRLEAVEAVFARMVAELSPVERVSILCGNDGVADRAHQALRRVSIEPVAPVAGGTVARAGDTAAGRVELVAIETDDAWIRDTGPIFVERRADPGAAPEREAVCFRFDTWGGKYPPGDCDARVSERVAARSGVFARGSELVLEGGSIDGDGNGTVLTTEECLLHPNRGGGRPRKRELLERSLAEMLGARQVIWLGRGIVGDDTDGHVDDIARFVAPGVVVAAAEPDADDANHAALCDNLARLRSARDADGKPLSVVELPMPPPVVCDGQRLPASYLNFYLANGIALVPLFGAPEDQCALDILSQLLAERRVVGIPARDLVIGFGAIHCLSQQEPALAAQGG